MPLIKRMRPQLSSSTSDPSRKPSRSSQIFGVQKRLSKMEETIIETPEPQMPKQPVQDLAVPARNELRTSRYLESLAIDLSTLDKANLDEIKRLSQVSGADPHELYISSEEDPSESADDASLFGDDLDDYSPVANNYTFEETARIVPYLFVGKAQVVEIYTPTSPRRHDSKYDFFATNPPAAKHSRQSSLTSRYSESFSTVSHPPRSSSKSSLQRIQTPASFLESDPYPQADTPPVRPTSSRGTKMPTPKLGSSATWKDGFKGVSKSFVGHMRRPTLSKGSSTSTLPSTRPRPLSRNMTMPVSVSTSSINSMVGHYHNDRFEEPEIMDGHVPEGYAQSEFNHSPQPRLVRAKNSMSLLSRHKSVKSHN